MANREGGGLPSYEAADGRAASSSSLTSPTATTSPISPRRVPSSNRCWHRARALHAARTCHVYVQFSRRETHMCQRPPPPPPPPPLLPNRVYDVVSRRYYRANARAPFTPSTTTHMCWRRTNARIELVNKHGWSPGNNNKHKTNSALSCGGDRRGAGTGTV